MTKVIAAAVLLAGAVPASAANVLLEDFSYGPDTVLDAGSSDFGDNWDVTDGSVDYIVGDKSFGELCSSFGYCVDLDGTGGGGGTFSTRQVFGPGRYLLTFQMSGNQRDFGDDTVTITFGGLSYSFTLTSGQFVSQLDFAGVFDDIVVGPGGSVLTFSNSGNDDRGAILKSVSLDFIAAIPLPAGGALLAGGLGLLAAARRRRAA